MYWIFELLVRYGLIIGTGILFIWLSRHRAYLRKQEFSNDKYASVIAEVKSVKVENNNAPGRMGYIYHIEAEYAVNGTEIVSISQNKIHSEKDYEIGEQIEIIYERMNPSFFYIADDRNFMIANGIETCFGIVLLAFGIVLLAMRLMGY